MKKIISIILIILTITIFSSLVSAQIENSPLISVNLVNQDPDPAIAGDIVEVRIGVTNIGGGPANNVIIELDPEYPFKLLSGDDSVQKIGTIIGYQGVYDDDTKIIKYKLAVDKDATAGEYELKVKSYEEGSTAILTKNLSIDIENKQSAEVIYINQVELIPGKITPLNFTINNVGSAPLRDLTFSWENEDDIILPVSSDNTKYIKYIDIGNSSELTFNVIASANADPDLYKLDLTLVYDDPITREEKKINTKAGVYVGGATDFDAAFSGSSNGEYSFAISNIGSVSASSVTVKIPNQQEWQVSGSNSVIIGNLNKGDYTIASFKLQKKSQPKNLNETSSGYRRRPISNGSFLKIEIIYTDSRGNRNTIEKGVFVDSSVLISENMDEKISRIKKTQNPWTQIWDTWKWILLVIIVFVLVIIIRKKYKREKKEKSDYTYFEAIRHLLTFKKK